MSLPQVGKIYTFTCMVFPDKRLNLCGSAGNGGNVAMINADENEITIEEQWKYHSSGKLLAMKNTSCVLDRYAASGTQYNNADVWTNTSSEDANQVIAFEETIFPNTVKIRLASTNLYLQANSGNGTSGGKSTTSTGNAYWDVSVGEDNELWVFSEVGATSGDEEDETEGQKLVGPYPYAGVSADYNAEVASSSCSCYPHSFHYGTDFKGREANGATTATQIRASGNGVVMSTRTDNNESTALGNTVLVRYDNVLNTSGVNIGSVYFRYCHLASINVVANQSVTASTIIGTRGTSGYGCAENQPHLHLEATTNSSATASNSPSEASNPNDTYKFDVRNVLYTKTSTGGIGKRVVVTDNYEPFNSNVYCSHGKAWYSLYDAPSYD